MEKALSDKFFLWVRNSYPMNHFLIKGTEEDKLVYCYSRYEKEWQRMTYWNIDEYPNDDYIPITQDEATAGLVAGDNYFIELQKKYKGSA